MASAAAAVAPVKILFVVLVIIKILIIRFPDCYAADEISPIVELTGALKHVVERHTALECNTLHFKVQWSTPSGKQLLLDIVNDVVPTIVAHSVTLSTPESNRFGSGQETHFVWLFDTLESFNILDGQLRELSARNPYFGNGVYLLVCASPRSDQDVGLSSHLVRMLSTFHELNIFSVNVMLNAPDASDGVYFYTYIPFQQSECHVVRLHLINIFRNGSLQRADIFLSKIADFHGCPLRIMVMKVDPFVKIANGSNKLTGFEGEIINTIVMKLNASLTLLPQPNETSSVLHGGDLRDNSGDFIVGLQYLSALKMKYFTPSIGYYTTPQVLVLLKGRKIDSNSNWLLSPFTNKTWLYVGLCCAFLLPFGAAIQYTFSMVEARTKGVQHRYVVMNVFALILGISQSLIPKRSVYRLAFAATTLSLLVLRSIYQGKIYDDYRSVEMDDAPNTLEELIQRNFTILTTYAFDVPEILTQNTDNSSSGGGGLQIIRNDLLPAQSFELLQQQTNSNVAITTSYTYYIYYVNEYNKNGVFKVLQQPLVSLKGCLYFRRHSYIQQEIDSIINRLEPSGILSKWTSQDMKRPSEMDSEVSQAINMNKLHLVTMWYIYFSLLAIFVFICEVMFAKYWPSKEARVPTASSFAEFEERVPEVV